MTACRLDFSTDGWHIFAVCDCGAYREDITGDELPLIVYRFNRHCDARRAVVATGETTAR